MIKVLVLQNTIMHYRKTLYNALSTNYDITIMHSGEETLTENDHYKETIVPVRKIGPFYIQSNVIKEIKSRRYDIVIAMSDIRWIMNMLAIFMKSNICLLYWGHRYSKNGIINKVRDYILQHSDGIILYSDSEVERLISRGIDERDVYIAPNTVHVENASDGSAKKKDSLLFVGRAQRRKKIDELIKAFSQILNNIPGHIIINIVGEGKENELLAYTAQKTGVSERVVFHGSIIDDDKLKVLFDRAIAYVSPGPVGLGVLHSLAYGVPVVTNKEERHGPEFDNLADNENALFYSTNDEFKEILVKLCNNPTMTARLGKNAYELYKRERTIDVMVNGFRHAIDNACKDKRHR